MGKKRKISETEAAANVKKEEFAPERPPRTLFGFKNPEDKNEKENDNPHVVFRNKEKVLVTCTRRISFRFFINYLLILDVNRRSVFEISMFAHMHVLSFLLYFLMVVFRYRHLMLNLVDLLPHCKKDNKVESKESKGTALNELVELKSCSSCLFFEVCGLYKFLDIL